MKRTQIPVARDIMRRRVQTVSADEEIESAVRSILRKGHSGAPVLDPDGALVGVLSEHDCVSALAEAAADRWPLGRVSDHMTRDTESIAPSEDLFAVATRFSRGRHRRLLVVEDGVLVGLISRRDLLRTLLSLQSQIARDQRDTTYEAIEKRHIELD